MDDHLMPSLLPHQGFHATWTKLYSVGSCYLDLRLEAQEGRGLLLGKVVGSTGEWGQAYLLCGEGKRLGRAALGLSGTFRLPLAHSGIRGLELELGAERFVVPLSELG